MSDLPISNNQAMQATKWLMSNFGDQIRAAVKDSPFLPEHICAIACQETAYFWLRFINTLKPADLLARCVLDASGDVPGSSRGAFPKNTGIFRQKYGNQLTNELIEEANKTRILRGLKPAAWVYKGYGIFQYDLQFIIEDELFFRNKQWQYFDQCLARVMKELDRTFARHRELWKAIRAYNGAGTAATIYAHNVMHYTAWCREAIK